MAIVVPWLVHDAIAASLPRHSLKSRDLLWGGAYPGAEGLGISRYTVSNVLYQWVAESALSGGRGAFFPGPI